MSNRHKVGDIIMLSLPQTLILCAAAALIAFAAASIPAPIRLNDRALVNANSQIGECQPLRRAVYRPDCTSPREQDKFVAEN